MVGCSSWSVLGNGMVLDPCDQEAAVGKPCAMDLELCQSVAHHLGVLVIFVACNRDPNITLLNLTRTYNDTCL